ESRTFRHNYITNFKRRDKETMSAKCKARKRNGKRCDAWALQGKGKCALHSDPELAAKMGALHRRGTVGQPDKDTAVLPLPKTAIEVRDSLATAMAQVQARKKDTKTANALAYVGTSLLRAIEVSGLEERVRKMELQANSEEDKGNVEP